MIYMLNLVFDYTDSSCGNGRFVEYESTQPLLMQSKVWLESSLSAPDYNLAENWALFHKDAEHLSFPKPNPPSSGPTLVVRVVDKNQNSYSAEVAIIIARNTPNSNAPQLWSSPIQGATQGSGPLAYWNLPTTVANVTTQSIKSWVQGLTQATQASNNPKTKDKYTILVAAWIQPNDTKPQRTLSHDPDMNIDC